VVGVQMGDALIGGRGKKPLIVGRLEMRDVCSGAFPVSFTVTLAMNGSRGAGTVICLVKALGGFGPHLLDLRSNIV